MEPGGGWEWKVWGALTLVMDAEEFRLSTSGLEPFILVGLIAALKRCATQMLCSPRSHLREISPQAKSHGRLELGAAATRCACLDGRRRPSPHRPSSHTGPLPTLALFPHWLSSHTGPLPTLALFPTGPLGTLTGLGGCVLLRRRLRLGRRRRPGLLLRLCGWRTGCGEPWPRPGRSR